MKQCTILLVVLFFIIAIGPLYGQAPTPQQAAEMARRLRGMSPQQLLKFRDSLMQKLTRDQAKVLPNGNQLLQTHHYDTTFTTVTFSYSKKVTGPSGTVTATASGNSKKAPVMYEANGHTLVQCSFNANTAENVNLNSPLDNTAKSLNKSKPYMTAEQANAAGNISRQASFSSLILRDNSIKGSATFSEEFVKLKSVDNISFNFMYDPLQHISTISVGANVTLLRTITTNGRQDIQQETTGIGVSAATDPSQATIAGGGSIAADPDVAYARVDKTKTGFKVSYTKISHDETGTVTETLTAIIGEPLLEYEAIIKPYKFNYEHWLPKGPAVDGTNDKKGDDSSRFYIFVQDKTDPTKQYPGNFTVKWALKNVTRYQGFCSNYPLLFQHPDKEKDLKVSDSMLTNIYFDPSLVNDSVARTQKGDGILAILRVMCMDYGAWGKLYAEITLDNGQVLQARPYYKRDGKYLTIPFDEDENKLADAWEAKERISHLGYKMDWDEDLKPDNGNPGDDIVLIDEYRGFLTEDDHYKPIYKRFSPNVKELISISLETTYGLTYKDAIRSGVVGYSHAAGVNTYLLTNEKYGLAEIGVNAPHGRWVNFNSPFTHHTHGVIINAFSTKSPRNDPNVLGSTKGLWNTDPPGYNGAQVPAETEQVFIWAFDITNSNEVLNKGQTWYLPARPEGNDDWNKTVNNHVAHANVTFHTTMNPLTLSNVVAAHYQVNKSRLIANTVAHELCHATNVNHHHFDRADNSPYSGVITCPVRYWMDPTIEDDHSDWIPMFLTGLWDPSTATTPYGMSMTLCKTDDDCFHKLKLKK